MNEQVRITVFVDVSHAQDKGSRWSHIGYIIFTNRVPVLWYSKKQNTVASSAFSSEFIASMKTCTDAIIGLRFKLRMLGVTINTLASVLCDNDIMVNNSTK